MSNSKIDGNEALEINSEAPAQERAAEESVAGIRMVDILTLPEPLRQVIVWMIRKREVALADLAARLQQDEATARSTLDTLVERGYLWETRVQGEARYRVRLAPQRKRQNLPLDF